MASWSCMAMAQKPFVKTYGRTGDDVAYGVLTIPGKGYLLTGYTTSYGKGNKDVFLLKLDVRGDVKWMKAYGNSADEVGINVVAANDGGYFIVGHTKSCGGGDEDGYLLKTDSLGTLKWTKTIGGKGQDQLIKMYERPNGEVLGVLKSRSYLHNNGFWDYYSVVIDNTPARKVIHGYGIGEQYNDLVTDLTELPNGDFLMAGTVSQDGASNLGVANGWLLRTDKNGVPYVGKNQYAYGVPNSNLITRFHAVERLSSTANLVLGESSQLGSSGFDLVLGKVDNQGDSLWFKRYEAPYSDGRPKLLMDGDDVIMACRSNSLNNGSYDVMLACVDTNGIQKWSNVYGSFATEDVFEFNNQFIAKGANTGFAVVTGNSEYSKNGDLDIYFVKTGSKGEAPKDHVKSITLKTTVAPFTKQVVGSFSKSEREDNPDQSSCGLETTVPAFTYNKVWTSGTSVIANEEIQPHMALYPNPALSGNVVTLEGDHGFLQYHLYGASGTILSGNLYAGKAQIDCSNLKPSIYFIRCTHKEGFVATKKLIILQ